MLERLEDIHKNPYIPPGALPHEVADDIPALMSEGEFVFPADVVRWHGLKALMALRDEAKQGLMSMQSEGQIQGPASIPTPSPSDNIPAFAEGGLMGAGRLTGEVKPGARLEPYTDAHGRTAYRYVNPDGTVVTGKEISVPLPSLMAAAAPAAPAPGGSTPTSPAKPTDGKSVA